MKNLLYMKNVLFIFIIIWALDSCTKESYLDSYKKESFPANFPQKWQLISMSGQIPNSTTTGHDMEWQESYFLNSDGTFSKSRERNGILTEASGTFEIKNLSDGLFLELSYNSATTLIASCTPGLKETLWVRSESKMSGTWSYCDGPGLEYERIK
jgi:hypothetical protein